MSLEYGHPSISHVGALGQKGWSLLPISLQDIVFRLIETPTLEKEDVSPGEHRIFTQAEAITYTEKMSALEGVLQGRANYDTMPSTAPERERYRKRERETKRERVRERVSARSTSSIHLVTLKPNKTRFFCEESLCAHTSTWTESCASCRFPAQRFHFTFALVASN